MSVKSDSEDHVAGFVVTIFFILCALIVFGVYKCTGHTHKPDKLDRTAKVLEQKWEKWLDKNESK
jgi:hypothetical protein